MNDTSRQLPWTERDLARASGNWNKEIQLLAHRAALHAPDRDAGAVAYELRFWLDHLYSHFGLERIPNVFQLTCALFRVGCSLMASVRDASLQDRDGEVHSLLQRCASLWEELLVKAPALQKSMHQWFADARPDDEHFIETILFTGPWNRPLLEQSLSILTQRMEHAPEEQLPRLVQARIRLLTRLKYTHAQILQDIRPWHHLPQVRTWEIRSAVRNGQDEDTIRLLLRNRDLARETPALVQEYTLALIRLYRKTGQKDLLRQEMTFLVLDAIQPDQPWLDWVRRLKALVPAGEWPDLREKLLARHPEFQLDLLDLDGDYAALAQALSRGQELHSFLRFEAALRQWSPEEALNLYAYLLDCEMHRSQDVRDCPHMIEHLVRLARLPGGADHAVRLAQSWKKTFPERLVLQKQLELLGY